MSITNKLEQIKQLIPKQVKLVAVSKTKPQEDILTLYEYGHKVFGENKVQELKEKYENLPKDIEWHHIGHLQTNKVKYIAPFVSLIHAVDSFKLLKVINKEAQKNNRKINVLLQMHIAQEETKFGLSCKQIHEILQNPELGKLENIQITGLMGMATNTDDKEQIRKEFRYLKSCFDEIKQKYFATNDTFRELSMGMSGDFQIAIEEGTTIFMIENSIFSARNYTLKN